MKSKTFNFRSITMYMLLLVLISCSKDETKTKDQLNAALVTGYWKLSEGKTFAVNSAGNKVVTATLKPGVFAYEILADGTFISHDLSGNNTASESGKWKLEVETTDAGGIVKGSFAIATPTTMASKGMLFIDNDGYQRFSITTISDKLNLTTKKYALYPNAENWGEFHFEKQ